MSRLTRPAKVAVRPLNMKMNTLKKATTPKTPPATAAPGQAALGAWNAPMNSRTPAESVPSHDGEV